MVFFLVVRGVYPPYTLSGPTIKKTLFYVCPPLVVHIFVFKILPLYLVFGFIDYCALSSIKYDPTRTLVVHIFVFKIFFLVLFVFIDYFAVSSIKYDPAKRSADIREPAGRMC